MIIDFTKRWEQIGPLLDRIFDLPATERTEWLRRHTADPELRALVTRALDNAGGIDAFERDISQYLLPPQSAVDALPTVPGYGIRRFIGAGGMASVFEAERRLPGGGQTVALKLLRVNVHDPDERARFLREQGILARLGHRHIAGLLDAGFTSAGTPFLVLEFVAGGDLVEHCKRRGLDTRARLRLFTHVCMAVEHAHRNLIVHRDLKPRNVLVDADGCVKLVDFGIAKLLTGDGDPTRTQARRLTRWYAAPEQLTGGSTTTAIDVYALGALLAELLGGRRYRAHDRTLRASDAAESDIGAFDGASLRREFGADLFAIVREATQNDPQVRYASVADMREDIQRHLQGMPVRARSNTIAYRTARFVKRNLPGVLGVSAGLALLGAATAISLIEAQRAQRAARQARAQTQVAKTQAQRADAVTTFLEGLFDSASPGAHAGETAEQLLTRGRQRADRDFARQPALRVEIFALIGDLQRRSGHPDRALQPLKKAAALARAYFGASDPRSLHAEYLLAKEGDELGHVREAAARLQRAVDAFHSPPDRGSREQVGALAWLAGLDERLGQSAKAIRVGDEALALARRVLGRDSPALTEAVQNLGWIELDAGRADRAEPLLREALARKRRQFGQWHPDVADAMAILSAASLRRGQYAESERLLRNAIRIDAKVYAGAHPHAAWHLNDLANVLVLEGKFDQAGALYRKSLAMDRRLAPASAFNAAVSLGNLARLRYRRGDYAGAESGFRNAIDRKQHLLGSDYADNGRSYDRACLAQILIARRHFSEAHKLIDEALSEARRRHRGAHPDIAFALTVKAGLELAEGRNDDAAIDAGNAVATYALLSDRESDKSIRARLLYARTLRHIGRNSKARAEFADTLAAAKSTKPATAALIAQASSALAQLHGPSGND